MLMFHKETLINLEMSHHVAKFINLVERLDLNVCGNYMVSN